MRTWAVGCLALITVVALAAGPASADEQDPVDLAKDLAREGFAAHGNGDLDKAVELLKRAALLDPQPEYFCSAGNVYDQMGEHAQAHLWLSRCLAGGRFAARKPEAAKGYRTMLTRVEQALRSTHAPVEITSSPSGAQVLVSAFADDDVFTTPGVVWLPVGSHTARLRADGHDDKPVSIEVGDTTSQRLNVTLERPAEVDATGNAVPDTRTDAQPEGNPDTVISAPLSRDTPAASRGKTPYVLMGVGGVSLITGAVFHIIAVGTRGELADLPEGQTRDDRQDTFNLQRGLAIGGYAVGAIIGGIGLYLWSRSPKKSESVAFGPAPTGDGAMVWLSWSR